MASFMGKSGFQVGSGKGFDPKADPDDEYDPLAAVDYENYNSREELCAEEVTAVQQGFRDRRDREADRFRLATDSEFWFAVCFRSRAHKEAFLMRLTGLPTIDAVNYRCNDKYIDGHHLAKMLDIDLSDVEP